MTPRQIAFKTVDESSYMASVADEDDLRKAVDEIFEALAAAGYAVVPVEPTDDTLKSGDRTSKNRCGLCDAR